MHGPARDTRSSVAFGAVALTASSAFGGVFPQLVVREGES